MKEYNFCLLGFGNVGRNMITLLRDKDTELRERYGIDWRITGVATRRLGWLSNPDGIDVDALLRGEPAAADRSENVRDWLAAAKADVLFEITSLNPETGQPAIDHIQAALTHGAHAITANKGTLVHGYHMLRDLAQSVGKAFLFESCVADSLPVFSLFRDTLPTTRLLRFDGLFNATTSVILSEMAAGRSLDEAIAVAQALGIAETDPSADIDGWDAAVKVVALATVLMDHPIALSAVQRQSIRTLDIDEVRAADAAGMPYRLVSRVDRIDGEIVATVRPEQVPATSHLVAPSPEALVLHFETDTLPHLTLIEDKAGPYSTAYGLLCDFLYAVRNERER